MNFRIISILSIFLFFLKNCISSVELERESSVLKKGIKERYIAAYVCAPEDLAKTEANLEFAEFESSRGNTLRVKYHLNISKESFKNMVKNSNYEFCDKDSDDDGIVDSMDKCPDLPEDFDGDRDEDGCPDLDQDNDGIDDDKDMCPTIPEDRDGFQDEDGCPDTDNDNDGIPDTLDQCPNIAEDLDRFEDNDGCPDPDNDKDGIQDALDKCPNEPEDYNNFQDDDGCPDSQYQNIIITEKKIELKQKIFFAYNSDKILPQSFGILNEIVDVLKKNPTWKIQIEGHTDDRGPASYNKKLSQKRADAVRRYLIQYGISPDRLIAIGYGEERPIADNITPEGRELNRRVEFIIISK